MKHTNSSDLYVKSGEEKLAMESEVLFVCGLKDLHVQVSSCPICLGEFNP